MWYPMKGENADTKVAFWFAVIVLGGVILVMVLTT